MFMEFVIMPNHFHLIWELLKPNGKESPVASLNEIHRTSI
jgi:REP element-mobilizing transposase RayT